MHVRSGCFVLVYGVGTQMTTTSASRSTPASALGWKRPECSNSATWASLTSRYDPAQLVIAVGTTVVWLNVGIQTHDIHARDGSFESPGLGPGGTFTFTPWARSVSSLRSMPIAVGWLDAKMPSTVSAFCFGA